MQWYVQGWTNELYNISLIFLLYTLRCLFRIGGNITPLSFFLDFRTFSARIENLYYLFGILEFALKLFHSFPLKGLYVNIMHYM